MNPLLSMDDVSLSFKAKRVLCHLSFEVERGECFGFLGPSGAGKTTTIKLLTRQLVKDSGRIMLFGRAIEHATNSDYERIGILSDTSALYERMTIEENLRFYAKVRGVTGNNIPTLLERMNLADDRKTLVKNCSKGMRQRSALMAALVHGPELLFLDEPTSGLDPLMQSRFIELVLEEKRRGATILLSSHLFEEVERTCDRVAFIRAGKLAAVEHMDDVRKSRKRVFAVTFADASRRTLPPRRTARQASRRPWAATSMRS